MSYDKKTSLKKVDIQDKTYKTRHARQDIEDKTCIQNIQDKT